MATIDLGKVIGEPGKDGANGKDGAPGKDGANGQRGSIIYSGTKITGTATTGTKFTGSGITEALLEDKYLNTTTNDMYTCVVEGNANTAQWAWIGNIQGKQGIQGPTGPTGQIDENTPIEFTSGDSLEPTSYKDIPLVVSNSALKVLMNRFSTAVNNVRYLAKMLGTTDISTIGGGTLTGAISELNGNLILSPIKLTWLSSNFTNGFDGMDILFYNKYQATLSVFVQCDKVVGEWENLAQLPFSLFRILYGGDVSTESINIRITTSGMLQARRLRSTMATVYNNTLSFGIKELSK